MPHAIWKGAITFGLVHVPVALYPATQEDSIDFDWLDKRSMDPVGYQRINKRTGKAIERENVVKGIKQDDGGYVILSDEQIKAAYPKTTQTIEIESFVKASEIEFPLLERPYFLEPVGKGEKVYVLLRESMLAAGVIGIARVVMHTKEHLAALIPSGPVLMLNTIRWASEMRSADELNFPGDGRAVANLKPAELKMATQLINDMKGKWKPEDYSDNFRAAIYKLVNQKLNAGDVKKVTWLENAHADGEASNVIDLTQLLARSLAKRKPNKPENELKAPSRPALKTTPAKKQTPKQPVRKRA